MNGKCKYCERVTKLTRHEKIARNIGGLVTPENVEWICDECHKNINSIMNSAIHKLKTTGDFASTTTIPQVGDVNLWMGSVCCAPSPMPIQFLPPIQDFTYAQGYPKDFSKQLYPYKLLYNSSTFAISGGSVGGWVYIGMLSEVIK